VWCCIPVIPAFGRLREENHKFKATLGYIVRPCQREREREREKKERGGRERERRREGEIEIDRETRELAFFIICRHSKKSPSVSQKVGSH
jgi:hypothetical protein